jgi:hypothetical protein
VKIVAFCCVRTAAAPSATGSLYAEIKEATAFYITGNRQVGSSGNGIWSIRLIH